jgi:DNA mismatch repair protein MutL
VVVGEFAPVPRRGRRAKPPLSINELLRGFCTTNGRHCMFLKMADRPQILVLPDDVVDQIAAGEVIERPASVVKELVDNALDAGARAITIEIEQGGKNLVRIIDDGIGMSADDVVVAVRRHATSKIRTVDDLTGLTTKGFRGEALPTIASVSRFRMTSRTHNSDAAVRLEINGGEHQPLQPAAAPVGTIVEVRDLLWNVPARQKFQKTAATEAGHVTDAVINAAMAHPSVQFTLRHDGRVALELARCGTLQQRVTALLPTRIASSVISAAGQDSGISVMAFLAPPEFAQTTARGVQLFVDKRAVKDRGLLHAVTMGYGELVARGRYPVAVVFVSPAPGTVDYNVHPQKTEVRFSDSAAVQAVVRQSIRQALAKTAWVQSQPGAYASVTALTGVSTLPPAPAARAADGTASADAPAGSASLLARRYAAQLASGAKQQHRATNRQLQSSWGFANHVTQRRDDGMVPTRATRAESDDNANDNSERTQVSTLLRGSSDFGAVDTPRANGFFANLRYLGQLDLTYLVCESKGELVLIDQHAAHERVEFARLKQAAKQSVSSGVSGQRMLIPVNVDVTPAQMAMANEHISILSKVGFEVEPWGPHSLAIKAAPADLQNLDPGEFLCDLLDGWQSKGASRAVEDLLDRALSTIACHSVVRAGDAMTAAEVTALLQRMDGVDFRAACPHGRPSLLRISVDELAKRFGRS